MTFATVLLSLLVILYFGKLESGFLLDDGCRTRHVPMMIKGRNATRAPWMAYLIYNGEYICGGSLVTSQFVLTAAHCAISTDNFYARLGEYDTSTTTDGHTYDFKVIHIFLQPMGQDIAILKLNQRVIFTGNIKPICIVIYINQIELQVLNAANNFNVTGWGKTSRIDSTPASKLQEISVTRIQSSSCVHQPGQFCCKNPSQFVCHGDSGSPLTGLVKLNDRNFTAQYGILSNGHEKCLDYANYVNVVQYTGWIVNTIRNNNK